MADNKAKIKKDLARARGVDSGTVLRFDICFEEDLLRRQEAKRYTYAAVFTGGKWWFTGNRGLSFNEGSSRNWSTHEELMNFLATDERVESVEIATGFEGLNG